MRISSGYFDPFEDYAPAMHDKLARNNVDFDTMVGSGLSGALVIPKLAGALGKKWVIVRKPNDSAHADTWAEGDLGQRWLFVDDFTESGATFRRVYDAVTQHTRRRWEPESEPEFVGAYLYSYNSFTGPERMLNAYAHV